MTITHKIIDKQIGRNAELFAATIGELETIEERYPYLRILVSIVEMAHPEWSQSPQRSERIAGLITQMCREIDHQEVVDVVKVRDEERGVKF